MIPVNKKILSIFKLPEMYNFGRLSQAPHNIFSINSVSLIFVQELSRRFLKRNDAFFTNIWLQWPRLNTRPLPRWSYSIYNFGRPLLGHHFYIVWCITRSREKNLKEIISNFSLYDSYSHTLAQELLPWVSWNLQFW